MQGEVTWFGSCEAAPQNYPGMSSAMVILVD